jgi:uncharacterized protein GlcG (DUF336 family)
MKMIVNTLTLVAAVAVSSSAFAACRDLPKYDVLKTALITARQEANGGFNLDMWGTIVDRDGTVCAVAYTGATRGDQWLGSRVISAQKANTANAFSLPGLALSTANLYTATQPGGSLFGLQMSNPVDTKVAYGGNAAHFGAKTDPMVGNKIGGINVFGGGLALYDAAGNLLGAVGVSGDSSCADHNIAWRTRKLLALDNVPAGVGVGGKDGIDYNVGSGWAHPVCSQTAKDIAISINAGG